ncbi:MAG: DUF2752 domain-containing protein [Bryobacterales bacterium]|nr:DUF2752 domain-containing protein [Bryobacterales bacterium]
MPATSSKRDWLPGSGLAAVTLAWLFVLGADATAFLVCPFRWATSLPCPLCGMTHGVAALLHGHIAEGVALHPFSPLALAGLAATAAGRTLPPPLWSRLFLGLAVFGAFRMLLVAL